MIRASTTRTVHEYHESPQSKGCMIRASTTCTVHAFSRTVQSVYSIKSGPNMFLQQMLPGKITVEYFVRFFRKNIRPMMKFL